jgi:rhodanese-related sulfurtransferase
MTTTLSPGQLKALLSSSQLYALIDVREWGEFTLEQIFGATNVARGHLEKFLPFLVPKKNVVIALYCSDGTRSQRAAGTAEALGYENVVVLNGGLAGWKKAGEETVEGWSVPGKEYGERLQIEEGIPDLTVEELHSRLQQGDKLYILDTRPLPEFIASHLPGAYSVPWGQMPVETENIVKDPDAIVVANCAGRTRSIFGAYVLRRMGYKNTYALKGGTGAWRIAGYGAELETGPGLAKPAHSTSVGGLGTKFAAELVKEQTIPFISPGQLKNQLDAGELLYVLDVRLPEEYVASHIPGARFCQATQAQFLADNVVAVRNAKVVTYCDDRVRAIVAASTLRGIGYSNVSVLDGGMQAWEAQRLPVEKGMPFELDFGQPPSMARLVGLSAGIGEARELPIPGLYEARARATFISPEKLRSSIGTGESLHLIDLRGVGEFATSHIPSAYWMSRGWLDLRIDEVEPDKNKKIVLYCRKGVESILASSTLKSLGYSQVYVLEGGFAAWKKAGLAVEEGLGKQTEVEEMAIAEIGLWGTGRYGFTNERMAKYLKWEEALGEKYRAKYQART